MTMEEATRRARDTERAINRVLEQLREETGAIVTVEPGSGLPYPGGQVSPVKLVVQLRTNE